MKPTRDIQTVSEFKQNASKLVKQVQKTRQPIILTVNGKPAVVLQDVETFQALSSRLEYDLTIAAINEALLEWDNSEHWSTHDEVFAELYERNGIE